MSRGFYLELAATGLRMPIGTDLVLHEHADPEAILRDGPALGEVVAQAAARYRTPLAIPLMDLRLEKADLLRFFDVEESRLDTFHFAQPPGSEEIERVRRGGPFATRNQAHIDSVRHIAEKTSLVPVGMAIGPFSLMTKLLQDPIAAIAMAGGGVTAEQEPEVMLAERCLELAELAVTRSLQAQVAAGARAVLICEPAANRVYLSPRQIRGGSGIFERYVIEPNLRLRDLLARAGVDLIFHDCGELTAFMVEQFATRLHPAILSLGSSRKLWEDAAVVPDDVVLYGNLPTKNFYSDSVVPLQAVADLTRNLIARMRETGHAHIPGSECDVLDVPNAAETIRRKVHEMLVC